VEVGLAVKVAPKEMSGNRQTFCIINHFDMLLTFCNSYFHAKSMTGVSTSYSFENMTNEISELFHL
jgi:hypothetical protein